MTALLLLGAWLSVGQLVRWRRAQGRLADLAARTGLVEQQPDLVSALRRHVHADQAGLRLGRALLAQELDRRWLQSLPPEERRAQEALGLERLDAAGLLAAEALARQPGSWDACLVLGGSNFLAFSRLNDPRLRSRPGLSEGLLLRARQLAPGRPESARLLAAFYLGNWSRLGPAERVQAMAIIAAALEDPTSFGLLVQHWLRVAPSLDIALSMIPDEPSYWRHLQQLFVARGDLERYRDATERLARTVETWAPELTARAERQIARGGSREGRRILLGVLSELRPSVDQSGLFTSALGALPPGPLGERDVQRLRSWLDWALELCLYSACPLDPDTVERLVSLVPDLAAADRAAAALAAEDLAGGERIEREVAPTADGSWDTYWLLKAEALAARGRATDAALALGRLSPGLGASLPVLNTAVAVAAAQGEATRLMEARAALAGRAASRWTASAWDRTEWTLRLALHAERTGRLATSFHTPPEGVVVEALLDGESLGFYSLLPGESWETPDPVPAGSHLMTFRLLTSRSLVAGEVRTRNAGG